MIHYILSLNYSCSIQSIISIVLKLILPTFCCFVSQRIYSLNPIARVSKFQLCKLNPFHFNLLWSIPRTDYDTENWPLCQFFVKMSPRSNHNPNITFSRQVSYALRDLVSFLQFKKREKHPWRSVTFSVTLIRPLKH